MQLQSLTFSAFFPPQQYLCLISYLYKTHSLCFCTGRAVCRLKTDVLLCFHNNYCLSCYLCSSIDCSRQHRVYCDSATHTAKHKPFLISMSLLASMDPGPWAINRNAACKEFAAQGNQPGSWNEWIWLWGLIVRKVINLAEFQSSSSKLLLMKNKTAEHANSLSKSGLQLSALDFVGN